MACRIVYNNIYIYNHNSDNNDDKDNDITIIILINRWSYTTQPKYMNPGYSRMDISNHVQSSCQITGSKQFVTILMSVLPTKKNHSEIHHTATPIMGSPFFSCGWAIFAASDRRSWDCFFCFYAGCIFKKCLQTWPQKCFHQLMATSIFKICRCESPNSSPYIKHSERWCTVWFISIDGCPSAGLALGAPGTRTRCEVADNRVWESSPNLWYPLESVYIYIYYII